MKGPTPAVKAAAVRGIHGHQAGPPRAREGEKPAPTPTPTLPPGSIPDAYAKCGEAQLAFEVLDLLPDMVSWATIMSAVPTHGRCRFHR